LTQNEAPETSPPLRWVVPRLHVLRDVWISKRSWVKISLWTSGHDPCEVGVSWKEWMDTFLIGIPEDKIINEDRDHAKKENFRYKL